MDLLTYLLVVITDELTTRLPMIMVSRKNGMQMNPVQWMQSHMDSIHSPHSIGDPRSTRTRSIHRTGPGTQS